MDLAPQVNFDYNLTSTNLQILKINLHLLKNRVLQLTIHFLKIKQSRGVNFTNITDTVILFIQKTYQKVLFQVH